MSRKINELIDLLVREIYPVASRPRDEGRIQFEPSLSADWLQLRKGLFDARQNQLASPAAFTGRRFVQTAVKIARQIDRGPNGFCGHGFILHSCYAAPLR
jgi:hypothetical protein